MYAMTIAASALGARLESHSFQPGFLLSLSFMVVGTSLWVAPFCGRIGQKGGENYADDSCFFVESGKRWL